MPLTVNILVFVIAALVIGFAGWKLANIADRLADRTGMGEAVSGALFLGASTSMPGLVTSTTAAANGFAELAVSNAIGGIAIQTVFLTVADVVYTRANLEHAAASAANILQGTLLISLLALPLLATALPDYSILGIHPVTILMAAGYIYGIQMIAQARTEPMWRPRRTWETREDVPEESFQQENLLRLWLRFFVYAVVLGVSGWAVAQSGIAITETTGLSQTVVGAFFTSISTSLPELVTAISAVRQGALTLAVSDIIGGNTFDTLFVAVSDGAYREGSIYHAITQRQNFLMSLTILLTGILLMGLVRRERRGIANIGFESFLILVLYLGSMIFLFLF